MVPVYLVLVVPPSLFAVAVIVGVIRANKADLPAIFRALMGRHDDHRPRGGPPSLPNP